MTKATLAGGADNDRRARWHYLGPSRHTALPQEPAHDGDMVYGLVAGLRARSRTRLARTSATDIAASRPDLRTVSTSSTVPACETTPSATSAPVGPVVPNRSS